MHPALTNNKCCLCNNKLKMIGDGILQNVIDGEGDSSICRNIIQHEISSVIRSILLVSCFLFYIVTFKRLGSTDHHLGRLVKK